MWFTGNYTELKMTKAQAYTCHHPGPADFDVEVLLREPAINKQLDKLGPDAIRKELKEYGAWDAEELADDKENRTRFVWCAACDIAERN